MKVIQFLITGHITCSVNELNNVNNKVGATLTKWKLRGGRTQLTFTANLDLLMKFFYTHVIHLRDKKLTTSAVHAELAHTVCVGVRNLAS